MEDDEVDVDFDARAGLLLAWRRRLLKLRRKGILSGRLLRVSRNYKKRGKRDTGENGARNGAPQRVSGLARSSRFLSRQ
jgi:hypothetical protein